MKTTLFILLAFLPIFWKNKPFTLYETGRPASLEYNNAKRTVGLCWGIRWVFAGDDIVDKLGHDKIGSHNDSVMALIAKKKGQDWQGKFYEQVQEELNLQNSLRERVMQKKEFSLLEEKSFEPHILFERKKTKSNKKWEVHIVGQLKEDGQRAFRNLCSFEMESNLTDFTMDCQEGPLKTTYPQNGIY